MNRRPSGILLAIVVSLAQLSLLAAEKATKGILGEGKPWATAYLVQDSGEAGPAVLIVGGQHGDEPAGSRAAAQVACWSITRGKLIVIPRANELALRNGTRLTPAGEDRNLNRDYPQAAGQEPKGELARALWAFAATARPAWLLDLHEGLEVHQQTPKSTGSSILHDPSSATGAEAARMLEALNATVAEPDRKFVLIRGPVRGGLACAAAEQLGARAMILETTSHRQPLPLRVRQHCLMVHRLLMDLDMLPASAEAPAPEKPNAEKR
jgi:predicted deacylase